MEYIILTLEENVKEKAYISPSSSCNEDQISWHRHLGHLNRVSMNLLKNKLADGVDFENNNN